MVDTSSNGIAVLICQQTPSRHDGRLSAKQPHGQWRMHEKKTSVTLSVDDDLLRWFEAQGAEFQHRINVALRIYAEAHQE